MNVIVGNLIMSRSYRKTPIVKDNGKHKQFFKRQANKRCRKERVGSGGEYKKHYEQYFICDWKFRLKNLCKKKMSK